MLIFTMFTGQVLCQPSGNNRNQNWPQRPDCPGPRCGAPGVPGSGCRARRATAGSAGETWRACSSPPPPPVSRPSSPPSAWRPAPPCPPATWCSASHATCYLSMVFARLITDSLCLSTLDQVSMAIYGRPFRKHWTFRIRWKVFDYEFQTDFCWRLDESDKYLCRFFQVYSIDGGWGTKQSDGHFNGIVGFKILRYR